MAHNHSLEPHFYSFGKTVRQAGQWDQNKVAPPVLKVPKVFISYSHDSSEHVDRVLEISNNLRADGIDCTIDQYEISPPEGWALWCVDQIEQADFVLVVCTEKYNRRFRAKDKTGVGRGAKWEGVVIRQDLYDAEASNTKFIPVVFTTHNTQYIPNVLRGPTRYDVSTREGYESLYRHLTNQPSILKPELGKLRPMPPLARRPGFSPSETEHKDEAELQRPVSDEEQVAKQTKSVPQIPPPMTGMGDTRLRSQRPTREFPTDFSPILFVNPSSPHDVPSPVVDLIRAFLADAAVMCCCIVAHYQMDVELSLLEIEEAVAVSVKAEKYSTVWIRGDELWCSPVVRRPDELFREDWTVLRQLRPGNIELDLFADEFDRLLDRANLLFILDFSRVTSNDLQRLDDPNQESRRVAIIDGVGAFLRNISSRGHRAVIGLPRHVLGLVDWRNFLDSGPTRLFACDLFDSSLPTGEASNKLCRVLPSLLAEALGPLLESNSYALRNRLAQEIQSLATKSGIQSAAREQQLREVLVIAGKLTNKGFLEPAYRLEVWYRASYLEPNRVPARADLIPISDVKRKIYGQLENICDLPKATDRAVVSGEPGQGKTTALQYIESYWSLPNRRSGGRKHPTWLPINLENLCRPYLDIANHFRRQSSVSSPEKSGVKQNLTAHAQLGRIATDDNLGWLFGSPVLYLINEIDDPSDEGQVAGWINALLDTKGLTVGLITSYRDLAEAPFDQKWFRRAFEPPAVEARLKLLDQMEATSICSSSTQKRLIESLFLRIAEPLNEYARNPFLVECICAVSQTRQIPTGCSLLELLRLYVRSKCEHEAAEQVIEVINDHLPSLAHALHHGQDLSLPDEVVRVGIRYNLLSTSRLERFKHPLLQDFFLARYLCANWAEAGENFLNSLSQVKPSIWETRYINLLRMTMKGLTTAERNDLAAFLSKTGQDQLAHRCLLELTPDEYGELQAAPKISATLLTALGKANEEHTKNDEETWRKKQHIARALGYYDSRILTLEQTLGGFVPVPVNEGEELLVGRFPITNLEFSRFLNDGGYTREQFWHPAGWEWRKKNGIRSPAYWTGLEFSRPNYPVVGVSFHEATAYARWLTEKVTGQRGDPLKFCLPAEIEWSLALGVGNLLSDLHGNQLVGQDAQAHGQPTPESEDPFDMAVGRITDLVRSYVRHPDISGIAPIGLFPPTAEGVYDLLGCIWQWCDEWFSINEEDEPPSMNQQYVSKPVLVRGGPAINEERAVVSLIGGGLDPFSRVENVGFRLICHPLPTTVENMK